jgi:hypothetical protein
MGARRKLGWVGIVALALGVSVGPTQAQIPQDGSIGIGTASPQEKLHVVGNVRFACPDRCISGHADNSVTAGLVGATIAGGDGAAPNHNRVTASFGTIGGGAGNEAGNAFEYATVGGGLNNTARGPWATVGGGQQNTASGPNSTLGGGNGNPASGELATVGGGRTTA